MIKNKLAIVLWVILLASEYGVLGASTSYAAVVASPLALEFIKTKISKSGISSLEVLPSDALINIIEFIGKKSGVVKALRLPYIPYSMVLYDKNRVAITQSTGVVIMNLLTSMVTTRLGLPSEDLSDLATTRLAIMCRGEFVSDGSQRGIKAWHVQQKGYTLLLPSSLTHDTLLDGPTPVTALVAATNNVFVSGGASGNIALWDGPTFRDLQAGYLNRHTGAVNVLIFLPNGNLASGASDNTIKIWDLETCQHIKTLHGHTGAVAALEVLPISGRLISGAYDNTIKLWGAFSDQCLRTFVGHTSPVTALTLWTLKDLVSGSSDGTIRVWDITSGACIEILQGHKNSVCSLVRFKNMFISAGYDNTIKIWRHGRVLDCVSYVAEPPALLLNKISSESQPVHEKPKQKVNCYGRGGDSFGCIIS